MNRIIIGIGLLAGAVVAAVAAWLLLQQPVTPDKSVFNGTVTVNKTSTAPKWTKTGQAPKPDYTPAKTPAATVNATDDNTTTVNATVGDDSIKEDDVVTFSFMERLAQYLADKHTKTNTPGSLLSFKALNQHFSRNTEGIAYTSDNINKLRAKILKHLWNGTVIEGLYSLYSEAFVEQYADTLETVRTDLSKKDLAAIFSHDATLLEGYAKAFRLIATKPAITHEAGKFLQASKAVSRANARYQDAVAGSTKQTDLTRKLADNLKNAIKARERMRKAVVADLKPACPQCTDNDLFYIAQWSYRRTLGDDKRLKPFNALADSMEDLAKQFSDQAADYIGKATTDS